MSDTRFCLWCKPSPLRKIFFKVSSLECSFYSQSWHDAQSLVKSNIFVWFQSNLITTLRNTLALLRTCWLTFSKRQFVLTLCTHTGFLKTNPAHGHRLKVSCNPRLSTKCLKLKKVKTFPIFKNFSTLKYISVEYRSL